jgi:TRAP-type C4-dicarboxylate transport system permease small subunit
MAERGLHSISAFVILAMTLLITMDVILRYVFNRPIPGSYEISEALMVLIVFLALSYTQARKGHLRVLMVVYRMPPRVRTALELFALLFNLGILGLIAWQGGSMALIAWKTKSISMGIFGFPLWIPRGALFLGGVALSIRFMVDFAYEVGAFGKYQRPGST